MNDAARWPVLQDLLSTRMQSQQRGPAPSVWRGEPDRLTLVGDAAELPTLLAEAASWAECITVCVTAPESQRGSSPWWRELLARNTKLRGVYVRRAEQAEAWLLSRLHGTGLLRLVESGGKQAASNLLVFARGNELRALLAHIPLERAMAGAAFGTLLSFQGSSQAELARACRAQLDSWAEQARIPSGSELDALSIDPRRCQPAPRCEVPRPIGVLTETGALESALAGWLGASDEGASVRAIAGGYRVSLERRGEANGPWALTLRAGAGWAAGNALVLDAGGRSWLVWRGALLGHSRARRELLWSEARLPSFVLDAAGLGLSERVAVVAHSGEPLGPQLAAFARELVRLGELFGVEPTPLLGHMLADFSALSDKQQTRLIWRSLIGLGAIEREFAVRTAASALRDQGHLQSDDLAAGSAALATISERIERAADAGRCIDRPSPAQVRAIQPDLGTYLQDDWLACLLEVLPEKQVVARRTALRAAFERAVGTWGLAGERLFRNGAVERALESCLSHALCRGLVLRVGAGGLMRPGRASLEAPARVASNGPETSFLAGWSRALESLAPVQRLLVTRRAGWYGRREALESVAERLGLTLERARQIELETWRQIEASSSWAATLRSRLARALAEARQISVEQLTLDDAWWRGVEQHLELADAIFENLCDRALCRVELGAPGAVRVSFARFSQAELDHAFGGLLERAAQVALPAPLDAYRELCHAAAAALDPDLCEDLREALEQHLELDPNDPSRAVRWLGAGASTRGASGALEPVDSEALLRLEDVLRSVFRAAGTPLSLDAVAERVQKRLDADPATLAARLTTAPFVQRNADQYGLIARDVPGGHELIAHVLNDLTEALASGQRSLTASDVEAISEVRVKRAWSPELVRSLIAGDPALYLSPTLDTTLRCWELHRPPSGGAPLCPGVPAGLRPRFETLAQQPLPEAVRQRLGAEMRRLEHAADLDDRSALPLARQLCDVSERLLAHAADATPEAQQLTHAAIGCLLDALASDGETPDAPPVDAAALAAARAVMAGVLHWLGLDWLERAPFTERPLRTSPMIARAAAQSGTPTRYNTPSPSLEM